MRSTFPYAQFPQAIGDLLNGTNTFMFITMLPVVDLIKTGKLRALAVTGRKRVAALPDVPTIVEAGFPALVVEDWTGFAVKRGTPKETVARLNGAINKALEKPAVREAFAKIGAEPAGGSSGRVRPTGQIAGGALEQRSDRSRDQAPTVTSTFRVTLLGTGTPSPFPGALVPAR